VKKGIDPSSGKLGIDGGYRFPESLSRFLLTMNKSMMITNTPTRIGLGINICKVFR